MVDCDVPSFSLGLDLDFDSLEEPQNTTPVSAKQSPVDVAEDADKRLEGDESGLLADDSDPDSGTTPPRRVLKRLRVGPAYVTSSIARQEKLPPSSCLADEDIEDFSSDDDFNPDVQRSTKNQFPGSTSKPSLNGFENLSSSSLQAKERIRKQVSDPSTYNLKSGENIFFSKLNSSSSPLRRFQLIDSDSDDSSIGEDVYKESHCLNSSSKKRKLYPDKPVVFSEQDGKRLLSGECSEDLWKDFCPVKSSKIATPAFDEVCEEYFRSTVTSKSVQDQESTRNTYVSNNGFHSGELLWDSTNPIPPAHRYFLHNDPRVRTLVRERLRSFSPIGLVDKANHEHGPSAIDYMGQFNNGEASKHKGTEKSSTTNRRNKSKNSNAREPSDASVFWVNSRNISSWSNENYSKQKQPQRNNVKRGGSSKGKRKLDKSNTAGFSSTSECWIDPKNNATNMPRDAAKRRVQASNQSRGHWYTSPVGKKIYVTGKGDELTGRVAYQHYRKESGSGSKMSKKKTTGKNKRG